MKFCRMQWSATRFCSSLRLYSRPHPSEKIAPLQPVKIFMINSRWQVKGKLDDVIQFDVCLKRDSKPRRRHNRLQQQEWSTNKTNKDVRILVLPNGLKCQLHAQHIPSWKNIAEKSFSIPVDNGKWAVDWTIEGCLFLRVFFGGIIDC